MTSRNAACHQVRQGEHLTPSLNIFEGKGATRCTGSGSEPASIAPGLWTGKKEGYVLYVCTHK